MYDDVAVLAKVRELVETHTKPLAPQESEEEVTVKSLDSLILDIARREKFVDEIGELTKLMNKNIESVKQKAVGYLKALDRKDFKSEHGTIAIKQRWRVNMPATDEEKAAFFEYLREQGLFDKMATVNSNSLNAYYFAEKKAAMAEGRLDFSVPGITKETMYEDLGYTRPRK